MAIPAHTHGAPGHPPLKWVFFAALKCYPPPKDQAPLPLPTATPRTPPQPDPLQGKPRHSRERRIFQGHAQGLRQGRFRERERHHHRGAGEGEVSPRQKSGCCYGAGLWEGGIPSNPSHPSLPHPPGNLNPGFSRASSPGATSYKKSSSLPSPAPQTTATNNHNIIKVASSQPSLGAGVADKGAPGEGAPRGRTQG